MVVALTVQLRDSMEGDQIGKLDILALLAFRRGAKNG